MEAQVAAPAHSTRQPLPELIDLVRAGKSDTEIEALLTEHYGDAYLVKPLMAEVRKLRGARATSTGLAVVLIGAACLLASATLSIMRYNNDDSLGFALFGLTTIGVIVVFAGLVKIFG